MIVIGLRFFSIEPFADDALLCLRCALLVLARPHCSSPVQFAATAFDVFFFPHVVSYFCISPRRALPLTLPRRENGSALPRSSLCAYLHPPSLHGPQHPILPVSRRPSPHVLQHPQVSISVICFSLLWRAGRLLLLSCTSWLLCT